MSVTLKLEYGDWVLQSDGTFQTCTGMEKCAQDVGESLQNNYDEDDPSWFNGSTLYLIMNNPQLSVEEGLGVEMQIRTAVEDAVLRLMELQDEDEYVDDSERISEIRSLMVRKVGASTYFFYLYLINDMDQPIERTFRLKLLEGLPPGIDETVSGGTELYQQIKKSFI
jgi:hypothetical protein